MVNVHQLIEIYYTWYYPPVTVEDKPTLMSWDLTAHQILDVNIAFPFGCMPHGNQEILPWSNLCGHWVNSAGYGYSVCHE